MKKPGLLLMCLALLLASCATERRPWASVVSIPTSQGGSSLESSSVKASVDYGDDPTSVYEREDAHLVEYTNRIHCKTVTKHLTRLIYDRNYDDFGPEFMLHDGDSWVNNDVVGEDGIGATVRSFENCLRVKGYGGTGEFLDGTDIKGVDGGQYFGVLYFNEICRHPCEAFFRITFVAKDNLEAITGYALVVAHPCGEPVEATDPDADIEYPDILEREPGPVWLDWTAEVVCEGVHFPKVEGLYQRVDPNRVEAALDIMIENAKGHYFQKAN
jgi:hypothetical protein